MKEELERKGDLFDSLPIDERGLIRYFKELEERGALNMQQAMEEYRKRTKAYEKRLRGLNLDDHVEKAPEIGRKTAEKLIA